MTDLHTHILPGMDDGARDAGQSIEMLKLERSQGVTGVALTPHFYPEEETIDEFLARREHSFGKLTKAVSTLSDDERREIPETVLGAEVAWSPGIADMTGLDRLCYEGTGYLLVELPFVRWSDRLYSGLIDLMNRTGLTPVIAHIDRYFSVNNMKRMEQLAELELPVQISTDSLNRAASRGKALKLLRAGTAHLLITDCHDTDARRPDMDAAVSVIRRKLGGNAVRELDRNSESIVNARRRSE